MNERLAISIPGQRQLWHRYTTRREQLEIQAFSNRSRLVSSAIGRRREGPSLRAEPKGSRIDGGPHLFERKHRRVPTQDDDHGRLGEVPGRLAVDGLEHQIRRVIMGRTGKSLPGGSGSSVAWLMLESCLAGRVAKFSRYTVFAVVVTAWSLS